MDAFSWMAHGEMITFRTNGSECFSSVELIALEHRDADILKCDSLPFHTEFLSSFPFLELRSTFFSEPLLSLSSASTLRSGVAEVELHRFGALFGSHSPALLEN